MEKKTNFRTGLGRRSKNYFELNEALFEATTNGGGRGKKGGREADEENRNKKEFEKGIRVSVPASELPHEPSVNSAEEKATVLNTFPQLRVLLHHKLTHMDKRSQSVVGGRRGEWRGGGRRGHTDLEL